MTKEKSEKPKKKGHIDTPEKLKKALRGSQKKRVRIFTEYDIKLISSLALTNSKKKIAKSLNIPISTFEVMLKRQPEADKAYYDAKVRGKQLSGLGLAKALRDGDISAIKFYEDNYNGKFREREEIKARLKKEAQLELIREQAKLQAEIQQDNGENDEWEIIEIG